PFIDCTPPVGDLALHKLAIRGEYSSLFIALIIIPAKRGQWLTHFMRQPAVPGSTSHIKHRLIVGQLEHLADIIRSVYARFPADRAFCAECQERFNTLIP